VASIDDSAGGLRLLNARYVIDAYACRWVIEEFHRVLKKRLQG